MKTSDMSLLLSENSEVRHVPLGVKAASYQSITVSKFIDSRCVAAKS